MKNFIKTFKKNGKPMKIEAYLTAWGYVVRLIVDKKSHYVAKVYRNQYTFCDDFLYSKFYSERIAKIVVETLYKQIKEA